MDPRATTDVRMGGDRSFGLVFAGAFTVISLWPTIWHGEQPRLWAVGLAAFFLLVALAFPRVLRPLNILWFRFGLLLGKVMTPIVMSIVFGLAILPVALWFKLRRRDTMNLRAPRPGQSLWSPAERDPAYSMKNQF